MENIATLQILKEKEKLMDELYFAQNEHTGELELVSLELYQAIVERQIMPEETKKGIYYVNNTAVMKIGPDGEVFYDVVFGNVDWVLINSLNNLVVKYREEAKRFAYEDSDYPFGEPDRLKVCSFA